MTDVTFIDWISPINHRTFNRSFFSSIGIEKSDYYIFSRELEIPSLTNYVLSEGHSRTARAIHVLRIIFKNRKRKVVLITYDPIFIIVALLFARRLFVIEHNTTPEKPRFFKHAVWQLIFLRGLTRLALFKEQVTVLEKLKQKCIYLGSPIPVYKSSKQEFIPTEKYYLSPSYRAETKDLGPLANIFAKSPLMVKKATAISTEDFDGHAVILRYFNFIDLEKERHNIKAIIISGDMGARISGWVNEGLGYGVPILAANNQVEEAMDNNFPGFPFVRGSLLRQGQNPDEMLDATLVFNYLESVVDNNRSVAKRFNSAIEK
tara:strand:- start:10968 stop:11924 length:957 start_codon:yes stop_codon:yes gene_type:complete